MSEDFATRLIAWQKQYGRHNLPWQGADAYRVWLSEIMLQQTQVATVIPYYLRFLASFPNIEALAAATQEQVLAHWSGLGYYARGRNLHKAAQIVVEKHNGIFPRDFTQILELPGIGRSTAAAVCALAYQEHRAILDGNVKRVLARYCGIEGWTGSKQVEQTLWSRAEALLPHHEVDTYTQSLMDMGASVCTRSRPKCAICPVQSDCIALHDERTTELPTPRPRKTVPEKSTTFLLLMYGKEILLEKRPDSGIWGGMWCPPQVEEDQLESYVRSNGIALDGHANFISQCKEQPSFTHTFTHFKLHITPMLLNLDKKPLQVQQSGSVWLDVEEALQAAIPTPVRKMLEDLGA